MRSYHSGSVPRPISPVRAGKRHRTARHTSHHHLPPGPGGWRTFRNHPLALISAVVLAVIVVSVLVGPLLYPTPADTIDFRRSAHPPELFHPFGFNDLGQDMFARVLVGGRISITVGLCATAVAISLGTLIGLVSGVAGGITDLLLMRLTDLFLSLPMLPLLLMIIFFFREPVTALLGPNYGIFLLVVLVIGSLTWMTVARLVRASVLSVREMEFVVAARATGASPARIVWSHVLPNIPGPIIVAATLSVSWAIVTESTLSFLGLGFPPDTPTWGRMLYEARDYLDIAPHMAFFPGAAIFLTVLCINYLGEGLQDMLNPRWYGDG